MSGEREYSASQFPSEVFLFWLLEWDAEYMVQVTWIACQRVKDRIAENRVYQ